MFVLKHRSGTSNRVADALSRRALVLSKLCILVPGVEKLADLYESDAYFGPLLARLRAGDLFGFVRIEGPLFKGTRLCIPQCSLRLKLVSELHCTSHVGRDRSVELVQRSYFGLLFGVMWNVSWRVAASSRYLRAQPQTRGCINCCRFRHLHG